MTPFKAFYGCDPPLLKLSENVILVAEVGQQIRNCNAILNMLKDNLQRAQAKMKLYADNKRRELEFNVGDSIYLKLQPYKFKSLAKKVNEKLSLVIMDLILYKKEQVQWPTN